eukprot:TRINITY_DN60448_c0_g2_i1.p1 TRINITY_DN60448_c0_g2~~TRINITY_DN60448_c0_g2_i1.p1  ORF type:complete len:220 (-),score=62.99 TRINITY_DN60448_c0_g2_i1:59-718(-)
MQHGALAEALPSKSSIPCRLANCMMLSLLHPDGSLLVELPHELQQQLFDHLSGILSDNYGMVLRRCVPEGMEHLRAAHCSEGRDYAVLLEGVSNCSWDEQMQLVELMRAEQQQSEAKCFLVVAVQYGEVEVMIEELREALLFHVVIQDGAELVQAVSYHQSHDCTSQTLKRAREITASSPTFMHSTIRDYLRQLVLGVRKSDEVLRGPGPRMILSLIHI